MIKPPRTRNRATKPAWQWSGLSALSWRSESSNVTWAQLDPRFKDIVTILTNERTRITDSLDYGSENRRLGRIEGYQLALDVLIELAAPAQPPKPATEEATYSPDTDLAPTLDYRD